MPRTRRHALVLPLLATALLAPAQATAEDWCNARDIGRSQHCEVRQHRFTMTGGELLIDVGPNGNIEVDTHAGREVRVVARVTARARNASAAADLAGRVDVRAGGGEVRASGPRTTGTTGWTVNVRVSVPAGVAVNARTTNGNITVAGTGAAVQARTTNGNITVSDVASRLEVRTTNGSVRAGVARNAPNLQGVQIRTTNGSVQLALPDGASGQLELSTTNGGITTDIPITVQGQVSRRRVSATLGSGGPEVRVTTTNGAIRISGS